MSTNTKIKWCDHTFNPWEGCTAVSPGCDNCYAEARNLRFNGGRAVNWGPGAPRRRTSFGNWRLPLKWNRQAQDALDHWKESGAAITGLRPPRRPRAFCASLADVFDNAVPAQWRADLFHLITKTPHLDWLLLTKRIGNVSKMLSDIRHGDDQDLSLLDMMPLPNVWIGATVVNQAEADRDIHKLLAVPSARRFLSIEPMLGPVDLGRVFATCSDDRSSLGCDCSAGHINALTGMARCGRTGERYVDFPGVDWVICGGESGPHARPMHPDWARSLRDQCAAAGVPFLFKRWGEWVPADQEQCPVGPPASRWRWGDGSAFTYGGHTGPTPLLCRAGKKTAGRLLDGREHNEFPTDEAEVC